MRLAVIPARGGSKRIPRKNLKPFHGRPIIAYSIQAANDSRLFDRVLVSTDDDEIAECARRWGAEAPFRRPAGLADDHTGTNAVVRHAAEWAAGQGAPALEICCLYATAPFVTADDLRAAHAMLTPDVDFVFAATHFDFPVQRALVRTADGHVAPMFPQWIRMRSQDLQESLHDAGQFYWGRPDSFGRYDVPFEARSLAYELPRARVQDIDTPEDWDRAEQLYRVWKAG
ncbi:MAG: pseudaminic acid cytidylyltransferase [Burkholderiaceae bacterium]|nr:pseudaminic acid cytidylyltransferase [Burkholderiaceae bacterium]